MARQSERPRLVLDETERERLKQLAGSRAVSKREVEGANILLRFAQGEAITEIQRKGGVSRPSIYKCIDKALATTAPDLPPVPGRHAGVGRDYEHLRHGTVSILAGMDLHDGHIILRKCMIAIAAANLLACSRRLTPTLRPIV